jgi:hypothetical protein
VVQGTCRAWLPPEGEASAAGAGGVLREAIRSSVLPAIVPIDDNIGRKGMHVRLDVVVAVRN